MTKHRDPIQPELLSLAKACRRAGITPATAVRLTPDEFIPVSWVGKKRVVGRRRFEAWLATKAGIDLSSAA